MAGGQGDKNYRDAFREAGLNTLEEQLKEADMVRVFRILNGDDNIDKETFWTFWTLVLPISLEGPIEGAGRRRFEEKEIKRTVAQQRKNLRKNSFTSRTQDPWNSLSNSVKSAKNPKQLRKSYRKANNLV